ncbi:hypothetical protein GLOIN_2v1881126 [Rhizophagus irregularis DAOM 181602=DAOM 197198]|nr:hypothetical protein GLOIN_2v1881126 [Rhizophagus irregularis DAOM 181602=DAOM 197198]
MSQMNEITLEIDEKIDDKIEPIIKIEVSRNEVYLVIYSHEDLSIVCWNILFKDPFIENTVKLSEEANFDLHYMCVSNNGELVYISKNGTLKIYDMKCDQKIKLNWNNRKSYDYCTFNSERVLILYNDEHKRFLFYSTQTKNNIWYCVGTFQISTYFEDFRLISISCNNECYLFSNKSIYKWDLNTFMSTKILVIDENIGENIRENIRIIDNEKFICTRIKDKIIIYSVELKIPVASLNLNNDIQPSMLDKYPTLCSLLFSDSMIMKDYWKKYLCQLKKQNDLLPKEFFPSVIRATSEHIFVFIDGNIWKIDLKKTMTNEEYDNDVKINEEMSKMYDHLHILFLNSYMDTVRELFQEAITNYNSKYELKASQNSIEWRITCNDYKIKLQVFKNNVSICTRDVKFVELTVVSSLLGFKLINDDDIIILTSIGPLIFHFNENDKSISLSYYYYYIILNSISKDNTKLLQIFSKPTLPLPNHESFKYNVEWVLDVKNNKSSLLKYGVGLLKFAIKEHNIINSNLPLLDKHYPEYILRYSLETEIIVDSPSYNIVNSLHLSSFQFPQKDYQFKAFFEQFIYLKSFRRTFYRIIRFINFDFNTVITKKTPSFIFASPYINFVNYPKDYNRFLELFWPQPSPFIETIDSDIYKTWSGEALLNFKWKKYGIVYHIFIWSGYLILLICFNVAAGISQQEYVDIQKILFIISTLFEFIYLSFEVRQFIYNPIKWILDIGKIYDLFVYVFSICTSILWLQGNDHEKILPYITFSCLLLNLKLMSFFRVFKYYETYYAIVIRIAKRVMFFFTNFIMVILISFSYAFYTLLSPKMNYPLDERIVNDDPNNPWNLTPNYQVFENNTSINPNLFILQKPDENTNMFTTFATSFFATCLLLTGDTSSFSNWSYEENPTLMILVVLFAFFMAIYILNVFITLFSEATVDHEDSFLITRAEYLAKIELFYLLPHQRRWNDWFPEVVYYCANIDETRKKVKKMIDKGEWNINKIPESKKKLMEKLNIPLEYEISLQDILEEIREMKNSSQNMLTEMQEIKKRLP